MPFARPHQLLTISGTHYGVDRFTIGFRLNNVSGSFPAGEAAQDDLCDDYAAAVQAWWAAQNIVGTQAKLDLVKLNEIGVDGKYVNGWTNLKEILPVVVGTTASPHAPQVAMAVTLMTGQTRGLSSMGRVFLPAPTRAVQPADGLISNPDRDVATTGATALLNAINGVDTGRRVVVASSTRSGAERTVQSIGVGRALDTIRARRSKMLELRNSVALAGAPF